MTHNNRLNASVNYDFMSTGIEFPKNETSEEDIRRRF